METGAGVKSAYTSLTLCQNFKKELGLFLVLMNVLWTRNRPVAHFIQVETRLLMQPFLLYYVNCVVLTLTSTLIIRISAQPRISAHLGQAHILKAEKVNKRPPPPAPNQTQISAHPHPTHLSDNEIEIEIESTNKRLPRGGSFCSEYFTETPLCYFFAFFLFAFTDCFVAKYKTHYTCWKWWKLNKRPLSRSKNLISAQGGSLLRSRY